MVKNVPNSLTRSLTFKRLYTPSQYMKKSPFTNQWVSRQISTFEYNNYYIIVIYYILIVLLVEVLMIYHNIQYFHGLLQIMNRILIIIN